MPAHTRLTESIRAPAPATSRPVKVGRPLVVCEGVVQDRLKVGDGEGSGHPPGALPPYVPMAATGSSESSRCPRQWIFGVSAEPMLTRPTIAAPRAERAGRRGESASWAMAL